MQVNISGQHVEVTQPLRDYVLEKLARVESHFDKITNCLLYTSPSPRD